MKTLTKENLPPCYHSVLFMISQRTKLNPVKSKELENMFHLSGSKIRDIVHYYRFVDPNHHPICSNTKGYWLARTLKEWRETSKNLRSRAFSMLTDLDKIEKKNFSGQQNFFT